MKKYILKSQLLLLFSFLFLSSCETLDLEQTVNPNSIPNEQLEVGLAFNYIQLELPKFVNSANTFTQRVTRQMAMTGGNTYDNAFQDFSFNNNWSTGYDILSAISFMEPKAIEKKEFFALGAAKIIRCYVFLTMVDLYGDIPYSEALNPSLTVFPKFDKSSDIYRGIFAELDQAIITIQKESTGFEINDLYYSTPDQWIKLANTLKLKMLTNSRLASSEIGVTDLKGSIEAILTSGNYINTAEDDFEFKYSKLRTNPNSRHPMYNDQYEIGGGAYICNYMFWTMTTEKGFSVPSSGLGTNLTYDPRTNFYFFKQANLTSNISQFTLPNRVRPEHYNEERYNSFYVSSIRTCFTSSNWIGGLLINDGYWGRDHGNNSGTPDDDNKRSVGGLYPIGGNIGAASSVQSSGTKGALGAGIMPIMLSSYVQFMKAEAILKSSVAGDAKVAMLAGIQQSIDKVTNFKPDFPRPAGLTSTTIAGQKTNYLNFIGTAYDAAISDSRKLELIVKEYFIATWGNGIEAYNNYRRTGYPSNFQPTLEPISGVYFSTAYYSRDAVDNNPKTPSNVRTKKVFWDKANLNLH